MRPTLAWTPTSWAARRTMSIPDRYPLGSVSRAHYHQMETNGEAVDFVITRNEFVGFTAELTPDGKDHILEIAARMRSTPFPVIVQISENNSNPELDVLRRELIAQILTDFGNPDANQRTVVSRSYGMARNSQEAAFEYSQYLFSRGNGSNSGNSGNGGGGF
jgi:hypothetical protein